MVAWLDTRHAFPHLNYGAGTLVAEYNGKYAFWICPGKRESICMANTRMGNPDQYLTLSRGCNIQFDDLQRLPRREGDSGT